jgi:formate dehydrogenase maturation protein FdhE
MPISNEDYINNSSSCPVCGSKNRITREFGSVDGDTAFFHSVCNNCESSWTDVYKLENIFIVCDKNEKELEVRYDEDYTNNLKY